MSCGGFFLVLSTFTSFSLRNQDECLSIPVWKSKFYGAFVLNRRVVLHAIDATPARWRGDAGSLPLDGARTAASSPRNDLVKNYRVHPSSQTHAIGACGGGRVSSETRRRGPTFALGRRADSWADSSAFFWASILFASVLHAASYSFCLRKLC